MILWHLSLFVILQGADASFLLLSKNFPSNTSEKDSVTQVGMRNSKYINDIKIAVDAACPKRVVSCADVLAVAGAAAVNVVSHWATFSNQRVAAIVLWYDEFRNTIHVNMPYNELTQGDHLQFPVCFPS